MNTVDTVYDTANRATSATRKYGTTTLVTSSTVFEGTKTVMTPQVGSKTASTVDVFGRVVTAEVYNGTTAPTSGSVTNGGTITQTTYAFNTAVGQATSGFLMSTVTDDGTYQTVTVTNLAGQVVSSTDPNAGTTTVSYDAAGNVTKLDDATTNTPIWTTYDALNRPLLRYTNTSGTSPSNSEKLAQWVYDGPSGTPATGFKGLVVKEISWQNSVEYTTEITSYTNRNLVAASKTIVPGTFGTDVLAGEWRYQTTYDDAGHPTQTKSPTAPVNTGAGDPTFDVVNTHYNAYGQADTLKGVDDTHQYVAATVFDDLARITQRTLSRTNNGTAEAAMVRSYVYNTQTRAVDNIRAGWDTTPDDISTTTWFQNDQYSRDPVGNVTRVDDLGKETSGSSSDTKECFVYDQWNRVVRAHTATIATGCLTSTTASPVTNRGLLPYDTVWAYDDLARMNARTDKLATTNTTYTYGDTGHPYAVTGTNDGTTKSYEYNTIGSMNRRQGNGTAGTGDQLAYDNQGRLTTYTGTTTQTYRYATTNQRLLRTEGTTRVLYLPGLEATDTNGTRTITNYRTIDSTVVATETSTAVYWNCGNAQNSTTCQAQAGTGTTPATPTRRHYQPYGNPRGTTTFGSTDHGFLNQPEDTTGLTYLNNRYYDPNLANFTTVDPLAAITVTPYIYGDGNPTTFTDPSGLSSGCGVLLAAGCKEDGNGVNPLKPKPASPTSCETVWHPPCASNGRPWVRSGLVDHDGLIARLPARYRPFIGAVTDDPSGPGRLNGVENDLVNPLSGGDLWAAVSTQRARHWALSQPGVVGGTGPGNARQHLYFAIAMSMYKLGEDPARVWLDAHETISHSSYDEFELKGSFKDDRMMDLINNEIGLAIANEIRDMWWAGEFGYVEWNGRGALLNDRESRAAIEVLVNQALAPGGGAVWLSPLDDGARYDSNPL